MANNTSQQGGRLSSTPLEMDHPSSLVSKYSISNMKAGLQLWWNECAWPGLGLFGESYLLFSVGTLKPLWEVLFPSCFVYQQSCSGRVIKSLSYSVVLGVICGMLLLGTLSNVLGRRKGSCLTAMIMCGGAWGLTLVSLLATNASTINPNTMVSIMSVLLFLFGVGVGGEYPLSASSASERAMEELRQRRAKQTEPSEYQPPLRTDNKHDKKKSSSDNEEQPSAADGLMKQQSFSEQSSHQSTSLDVNRGRRVQMVFSMQGMGIFCNNVLLTLLLWVARTKSGYNQYNNSNYNQYYTTQKLLWIWRITYLVGAAVLSYVLTSRLNYLTESQVWKLDKQERDRLVLQQQGRQQQQQVVLMHPGERLQLPSRDRHVPILQSASSVSSLSAPSVIQTEDDYHAIQAMPTIDDDEDLELSSSRPKRQCSHLQLLLKYYGVRLVGSSLSWMLWDVAFYGNKLFQSAFLVALVGNQTTLLQLSGAATLNATLALLGYFAAACLIDHPSVGRLGLQQYGFLLTGLLFVLCGFFYQELSSTWLVILYLGSSFFGQCGPNATTFVLPAEIFPTEMRTMCHGISAASGKIGALLAAILFQTNVRDEDLFLWSGYASFAACLVTFWTLPETASLDLYEVDRKWHLILEGRKSEYRGDANLPQYLSFYERQKFHRHFRQSSSVMEEHDLM